MRYIAVFTFLCMMLAMPLVADGEQAIFAVWQWQPDYIQRLSEESRLCSCHCDHCLVEGQLVLQVSFRLATSEGQTIHRVNLLQHDSLRVVAIGNLIIDKVQGYESATIRQEIKAGEIVTMLVQSQCRSKDAFLEGVVEIVYDSASPIARGPQGNCFKCSGTGKLGSWCTFCRTFVSWCIHGGSLRNCDSCSEVLGKK
jgi:hypothetical protein